MRSLCIWTCRGFQPSAAQPRAVTTGQVEGFITDVAARVDMLLRLSAVRDEAVVDRIKTAAHSSPDRNEFCEFG